MATADAQKAREEIAACERETQSIKSLLRGLGPASEDEDENTFAVRWLEVQGLPEAAKPHLLLQLSSPIEEKPLSGIYTAPTEGEPAQEGLEASFRGVETNQATLTVTAKDADIPLGSSTTYDLAPLTKIDATQPQPSYTTKLEVPIFPEGAEGEATEAVCTCMLEVVYSPSKKDQREELYELMNKTSKRRAAAVQELRQVAMAAQRQAVVSKEPAVKSGFLNKGRKKEPSKLVAWYDRYLGPRSMVRQVVPMVKNYVLFFGVTAFLHFNGQLLALPQPV